MREATVKGMRPSIQVLEITPTTDKCQLSDLMPNLPAFRRFFTSLPRSAAEVSVKQTTVLFTDIECVTKTIVKVICIFGRVQGC
jgi:antiviral helicase SKI2